MRIRHIFPTTSSRATVNGDRAFFNRNQAGDMLSFFSTRQTRYEGWFIQSNNHFYKILERITVASPASVVGITNTGQSCFWEYDNGMRLAWKLVGSKSGLTISASQAVPLQIILDMREQYAQPEFNRHYHITPEKEGCLITYQDESLSRPLFLHLRCKAPLQMKDEWLAEFYPRDEARNSAPTHLYTYYLATVTTDFLALGAGWSSQEASEASLAASKQRPQLPAPGTAYTNDTLLSQVNTAKASVQQALRSLQSLDGIYAGLPWFHQVWSRDELIAALGFSRDQQAEVIERYLTYPLQNGELPTFQGSGTTCADGLGWLCLLIREYGVTTLSSEQQDQLILFLRTAKKQLEQTRKASHGLIESGHNATWMDTIGRSGFRLEIQCMYALLLELLHALTSKVEFEQEQVRCLGKIKQLFWHTSYLQDGLGDPSIRPNLFLAYLLQPNLLSTSSWQTCFDTALAALQTNWGGLSSLDKNSPLFQAHTTGQNNLSYHNGDSWFFINNLAAIALHRFDARRYNKAVITLLQSSTDEILWEHFIGQPGEISSAARLESFGCGIQAFSGGTYLALLKQLENYSEGQERDSTAFFWDSTAASTADNFFK